MTFDVQELRRVSTEANKRKNAEALALASHNEAQDIANAIQAIPGICRKAAENGQECAAVYHIRYWTPTLHLHADVSRLLLGVDRAVYDWCVDQCAKDGAQVRIHQTPSERWGESVESLSIYIYW